MMSSELKLVPMWPDQAPAIMYERVDARQRRKGAPRCAARRLRRQQRAWNSETGT